MEINLRRFSNFDYILFLCMIFLPIVGIMFIYSSNIDFQGVLTKKEYIKQLTWFITGLVLFFIILIFYDYVRVKDSSFLIYAFGLILLIITRFFGLRTRGSYSWIGIENKFGIQPSEFMKLMYIIFLAYFFDKSKNMTPLKRFIIALVIMLVPVALILAQPDLGTASVYIPIFLIMCFIAGIKKRHIMFFFIMGGLTIVLTLLPLWQTLILKQTTLITKVINSSSLVLMITSTFFICALISFLGYILTHRKYYYWIMYSFSILIFSFLGAFVGVHKLQKYQIMRLIVFINPQVDPLDNGWNIIQSITAIGSGGLKGRGFLRGTQSHYGYLPEQSTDFIFSILSEEWGFLFGGMLIFALYAIIFFRIISCIKHCEDMYGRLIATGILAMFFFHFVVNIGMAMGIMPITGIPLLFLSYGGSSLWMSMIAIAIVMSINLRQMQ